MLSYGNINFNNLMSKSDNKTTLISKDNLSKNLSTNLSTNKQENSNKNCETKKT
jgi:hypothetical protein